MRISPSSTPLSTTATLPLSVEVSTARTRTRGFLGAPGSKEALAYTPPRCRVKKLGVLTGGGDCPGLNAVIRAAVRRAEREGAQVYGIRNGWTGLIDGELVPLDSLAVSGLLPKGGTILGTSRVNPLRSTEDRDRLFGNVARFGLDALIVIG